MIYVLCIFMPPLAVFLRCFKYGPFFLNFFLLGFLWIPAVIHAFLYVKRNKQVKASEFFESQRNKVKEGFAKAKKIQIETKQQIIENQKEHRIKKEEEKKLKEIQEANQKKEEELENLKEVFQTLDGAWEEIMTQKMINIPGLSQSKIDFLRDLYDEKIALVYVAENEKLANQLKGINLDDVIVLKKRIKNLMIEELFWEPEHFENIDQQVKLIYNKR